MTRLVSRFSIARGSFVVVLFVAILALGCGEDDAQEDLDKSCDLQALAERCPLGSTAVLGTESSGSCASKTDGSFISQDEKTVGQCQVEGSCYLYCEFASPCLCGVDSATADGIVCAECTQSCGDGRCEGTERESCEGQPATCFECPEDCSGATCGDGDCTAEESPQTCPEDCAGACTPNEKLCAGTTIVVCSADGSTQTEIADCADMGFICNPDEVTCSPSGVCPNGVCEEGEDDTTCPADCAGSCEPSSSWCLGTMYVMCSPDGSTQTQVECADSGMICSATGCVASNVCPNGVCESGEDQDTCPQDCAATCGNELCEVGEEASCPKDCKECGNQICEQGELTSCPQDCGVICVPNAKECYGAELWICLSDGSEYEKVDCADQAMTCGGGKCVPPDQCGNGACEGDEYTSCPGDCEEICGNGSCGEGEDFNSCSKDCPSVCGDGVCTGDEPTQNCPEDCGGTCGNDICDTMETREGCPLDCGYCGNGVCEDGYESPMADPPAPQEYCGIDCIKTYCTTDDDCTDGIACTTDTCTAGTCEYPQDDGLCGLDEVCLGKLSTASSGCCVDFDGDGFASMACGGSDCEDTNGIVYPGAFEVCGGGDMNCSGVNEPALTPAVQVTDSLTTKRGLAVAYGAGVYLLAWIGIPMTYEVVHFAIADTDGELITEPVGISESQDEAPWPFTTLKAVYSPDHPVAPGFAVFWQSEGLVEGGGHYPTIRMRWAYPDGTLNADEETLEVFDSPITSQYTYYDWGQYDAATTIKPFGKWMVHWLDGKYAFFSAFRAVYSNYSYSSRPFMNIVSEVGGVTAVFDDDHKPLGHGGPLALATYDGQFLVAAASETSVNIMSVAKDGNFEDSVLTLETTYAHAGSFLVYDGTYYGIVSAVNGGVEYEVFAQTTKLDTFDITSKDLDVHQIMYVDDIIDDPTIYKPVVAILMSDEENLYLSLRNPDGTPIDPGVELGLVGGGVEITNPQLFWNGDNFVVFYLAKKANLEQVFMTTVQCK